MNQETVDHLFRIYDTGEIQILRERITSDEFNSMSGETYCHLVEQLVAEWLVEE